MESRIYIRNMRKIRGDNTRKVEINIPTFEVSPASFTVIVGGNGSGKSTFLDMLGLLLSADNVVDFKLDMEVKIHLHDLKRWEKTQIRRNYISYVLQTGGLLEFLTIRENIHFAARLRKKNSSDIDHNLKEITRKLKISDILDKRPGKVSGGQRQKAAIARALIQESPIILADEPSSALDTESAKELMATFKTLAREKEASLIMVTHDQELAEESADRIYRFTTEKIYGGVRSTLEPYSSPSDENK
ncbi:MAG: ATP-binding cassette domain-containing protein [Candidatus Electrothrix sp. MAN1_4]|nr:ATP-binding cassette domain-containing protein [Candidatus Electrothrix sp. MAN1_4]